MSDTATVETITAEVRTLMVGSRQITASVYGQLDNREDPDQIIPFGRVTPKAAEPGWVYVVGKDTKTGELVRAETPTTTELIERKVERSSQAHTWQHTLDRLWDKAERTTKQAEKIDARAESELDYPDKGYGSAAYYEQKLAEASAREQAAETTLDRLKAQKEAAEAAYCAEQCRQKAHELQAEAAVLREQASEYFATANKAGLQVEAWGKRDQAELERLTALAHEWSGLPLIVLAGLR